MSNEVKYTTSGGIKIGLTATDTDAVLTVADTGAGISTDEQLLVFDRFYRASGGDQERAGIGCQARQSFLSTISVHLSAISRPCCDRRRQVSVVPGAVRPSRLRSAWLVTQPTIERRSRGCQQLGAQGFLGNILRYDPPRVRQ